MAALTQDRNTPMKDPGMLSFPVAATTKVFAGGIACANAAGFAVPGSEVAALTYLGRFEQTVDNSAGADGALSVVVRRNAAFKFENHVADPVVQADIGKVCYISDDQTVAATAGAGSVRPQCGIVLAIDPDGVWVGR